MTTEQVEVSSFIYDEIPISSILYVYPVRTSWTV